MSNPQLTNQPTLPTATYQHGGLVLKAAGHGVQLLSPACQVPLVPQLPQYTCGTVPCTQALAVLVAVAVAVVAFFFGSARALSAQTWYPGC